MNKWLNGREWLRFEKKLQILSGAWDTFLATTAKFDGLSSLIMFYGN
jgi:hypothetical protein